MVDFNSVYMSGRLVGNSEVHDTKSGKKLTTFSLANNDDYLKGEEWVKRTHFFNVIYNGEKKMQKGDTVYIEGKLIQVSSNKEKEGLPKSYIKILASKITLHPKIEVKPNAEFVTDEITNDEEIPF